MIQEKYFKLVCNDAMYLKQVVQVFSTFVEAKKEQIIINDSLIKKGWKSEIICIVQDVRVFDELGIPIK